MTTWTSDTARTEIERRASKLGFDACGFASLTNAWPATARLNEFIAAGRHGTMDWLAETAERRGHPRGLWPEARTAVVLGMNYGPDRDPLQALQDRTRAAISVYAQGRDYHEVIKGRLKELAGLIKKRLGGETKVFVDTAPLMEKPLAEQAGLGWQGKHTNLVSRAFGSWLFLGSVLTTVDLPPDTPGEDHCGACRACLDICPTGAFPAPYQLDARACLSYLTIEHAGPIPERYRTAMGNRIYGCDDCLAVCPWNRFADAAAANRAFMPRAELVAPRLADLLALADAAFREMFAGSPIKRIGVKRMIRNCLIAAGNSGDHSLEASIRPHLDDPDPVISEAAQWALAQLGFSSAEIQAA